MDALYTFRDNITHYRTKSVNFLGLMNSATKFRVQDLRTVRVLGLGFRIKDISRTLGRGRTEQLRV